MNRFDASMAPDPSQFKVEGAVEYHHYEEHAPYSQEPFYQQERSYNQNHYDPWGNIRENVPEQPYERPYSPNPEIYSFSAGSGPVYTSVNGVGYTQQYGGAYTGNYQQVNDAYGGVGAPQGPDYGYTTVGHVVNGIYEPSHDFHDSAMGSTPGALFHTPDSQRGTPLLTNFSLPVGHTNNESENEERAFGKRTLVLEALVPIPEETDAPKHKLLPRSRNGCWTCRTRKVKCDELHPRCGQCTRLKHKCDYTPRITWRDDTNRTVQRMVKDADITGSPVWDENFRPEKRHRPDIGKEPSENLLFHGLLSDEERERFAETRTPGKYFVWFIASTFVGEVGLVNTVTPSLGSEDPEVQQLWKAQSPSILSHFGHPSDKYSVILRHVQNPASSPNPNHDRALQPYQYTQSPTPQPAGHVSIPEFQSYHSNICPRLTSLMLGIPRQQLKPTAEIHDIERVALGNWELRHAILAVSQCYEAQGGTPKAGLEHYSVAEGVINNKHYLKEDGVMYTQLVLLALELLTPEQGRAELWLAHVALLKFIYDERMENKKPTNGTLWSFVATVELYGCLCSGRLPVLLPLVIEDGCLPGHGWRWKAEVLNLGSNVSMAAWDARCNGIKANKEHLIEKSWDCWFERPIDEENYKVPPRPRHPPGTTPFVSQAETICQTLMLFILTSLQPGVSVGPVNPLLSSQIAIFKEWLRDRSAELEGFVLLAFFLCAISSSTTEEQRYFMDEIADMRAKSAGRIISVVQSLLNSGIAPLQQTFHQAYQQNTDAKPQVPKHDFGHDQRYEHGDHSEHDQYPENKPKSIHQKMPEEIPEGSFEGMPQDNASKYFNKPLKTPTDQSFDGYFDDMPMAKSEGVSQENLGGPLDQMHQENWKEASDDENPEEHSTEILEDDSYDMKDLIVKRIDWVEWLRENHYRMVIMDL